MAKAKPGSSGTGSTGTALAPWEQRLADLAKMSKQATAGIAGGGNFLSFRGGNISYQGAVVPGNTLKVIVVDWVLENQQYPPGVFDESSPQSPVCYAFGRVKDEMRPDPEQVPEPISAACHGCPSNEWGSADTGRGKACAEVARLALLAESDFNEIESAEIAYAKIPVTSMKFWGGYVRELESVHHRPPLAFVTQLKLAPQKELPGWHVEFTLVEPLDGKVMPALLAKYDKVSREIMFPYPRFEEEKVKAVNNRRPQAKGIRR